MFTVLQLFSFIKRAILHSTVLYLHWGNLVGARGFPGDSVVKNLPAKAGDEDSIPGLGRSPEGGNGNPLQYSCLGNP